MRHPLWIVNSTLIGLIVVALAFVYFSQQEVPEREAIKQSTRQTFEKREVSKINISKIYEHDLFDTYQKEILTPKEPILTTPLPEAPRPAAIEIPPAPKPQFLDPLQISLKGIMATSDDTNNVAIVLDNKTKREGLYRVGDKIEDAQLIRIFKNKTIFLRSNGQQEVFYLRPQDAHDDPTFAKISDWQDAIKKIAPNNYQVNPVTFTEKISNLGQLIDMLDLTTAYQDGKSIGVRIGNTDTTQLIQALGLQVGDIVLNIAHIPATDTQNRMKIYKLITDLPEGGSVKVQLQRNGQIFMLIYTFAEFAETKKIEKNPPPGVVSEFGLREEQRKILEKKHVFAPTVEEIKQQERKNMLQKGRSTAAQYIEPQQN